MRSGPPWRTNGIFSTVANPASLDPGAIASAISLKTALFRHEALARGRLYVAAFRSGDLHDHIEQGRASRGA
jgi:hypothetical protein